MEALAAFLIGLISGTVGSIATGGALISVPALIFMGLSPVSAIATTRLSAVSSSISALYRYQKSKAVVWQYLPYFMAIALIAGVIGPKLLLQINQDILERIIGILLLLMLPLLLLKKDFGTINSPKERKHKTRGLLVLFIVMIYGTMFGAGGGIFLIYTLMYFFGLTVTEANATGTPVWLVGSVAALISYTLNGLVVFSVGIPLLIGAMIGGYLGAHIALKQGVVWVKGLLSIVIIVSGIKLIFFS